MLAARIAVLALLAVLVAPIARAQTYRPDGTWSTMCDNLRRCSAFGYASESESNAYVHVSRGGEPGAQFAVELVVQSDGAARDRKLVAIVHGRGAQRTFSVGPLDAVSDGAFAHAIVPAPMGGLLAASWRDARSLEIRLVDRAAPDERGTVSLAGSTAALRAMDAQQLHRGPPPRAPVVTARVMRDLPTPAAPGPKLAPNADPICASAPEMWIALGPGERLRGVCTEGGAYNIVYRFFRIAPGRRPEPVSFPIPWRAGGANDGTLVNPDLSKDGLLLTGFSKGIGLGTCGEASDWVWTGRAFRLFRFAEMRECRGVTSDSWPVLYQARMVR